MRNVLQTTGAGVDDNDIVITAVDSASTDLLNYDSFMLMSTAGAMDVFVSLDGTNYITAPLSLTDLGATATTPVIVTAANRMYGFRGKFKGVIVRQNGATAVENASLVAGVF